jgi:hypothetical protein
LRRRIVRQALNSVGNYVAGAPALGAPAARGSIHWGSKSFAGGRTPGYGAPKRKQIFKEKKNKIVDAELRLSLLRLWVL